MIFSELYSAYYNAVACIITRLAEGERDEKELQKIVSEKAFGESVLSILPALKSGRWQLVRPDMTPVTEHTPTMPLTLLQKRWLKSLSLDPRIKLFGAELSGLEGVEPLFTPEDYRVYDKYGDGDNFADEGYIERFRFLLGAVKSGAPVKIGMTNRNGKTVWGKCIALRLEYSEKDDKFRLITSGNRFFSTVNLAKITYCAFTDGEIKRVCEPPSARTAELTLKIRDERNAAERVMLHFAHFEKRVEKQGKSTYVMHVKYERDDETEMVVRVLSFGPLVEVLAPESFRGLIKERLKKQKNCELK